MFTGKRLFSEGSLTSPCTDISYVATCFPFVLPTVMKTISVFYVKMQVVLIRSVLPSSVGLMFPLYRWQHMRVERRRKNMYTRWKTGVYGGCNMCLHHSIHPVRKLIFKKYVLFSFTSIALHFVGWGLEGTMLCWNNWVLLFSVEYANALMRTCDCKRNWSHLRPRTSLCSCISNFLTLRVLQYVGHSSLS